MIPQHQLVMHDPDNCQYGDCFRACIASLLEKTAEEVPHFMDYPPTENDSLGIQRVREWLSPLGYSFIAYNAAYDEDSLHAWQDYLIGCNTYHLISGKTARGTQHAVVGKDGHVVHDPHPSGVGILQPSDENPWVFEFIIKRCA